MEVDAVVRELVARGLYARPAPFAFEEALFVSREDLRFEAEDGLRGWKESFLLRGRDAHWVVSRSSHGVKHLDEVVFPNLDEVVRHAHSLFDRSVSSLMGDS
ncbi:hypothetical protein LZ199_19795 [Myxococcus sp. QH3KD-4-1]|nr:hypothetical protein [Myxococcus qinghaiensis]